MALAITMLPVLHGDLQPGNIRAWHCNHNKKSMVLSFDPNSQIQGSKDTFFVNDNTPKVEEAHANGSANSDICRILHLMDQQGLRADSTVYTALLQECINQKALAEGKLVHAHMIRVGFNADAYLGSKLVIMYAKCGSLVDARLVLDAMPKGNVISWTAMIAAYARHGYDEEALMLYYEMQRRGIQPNPFTFASVLAACANLGALKDGKQVHEDIIRSGFQPDVVVGSALVDMYAKCGCLQDASQVFDKMPERNLVTWNTMIAAYVRQGCDEEALSVYRRMQFTGIQPNQFTFASVLPACAKLATLKLGKKVHGDVIRMGFQSNIFVGSALVDMYAKCGSTDYARQVFEKMPERNVVSWSALVAGYAKNGCVDEALKLFQKMPEQNIVSWNTMIAAFVQNGHFNEALRLVQQMQLAGTKADSVTFTSILSACASLAALDHGKEIHETIIKSGFQSEIFLENALIDMYAKCGSIEYAYRVFDKMSQRDVASWTAIIAGYAQNGLIDEALELFWKMPEWNVVSWTALIAACARHGHDEQALKLFGQMRRAGIRPNQFTFATVLSACANMSALKCGKEVYGGIVRGGFLADLFVRNALVDMYAKCGTIEDARKVFDNMPQRDTVSWTVMIAGCAQNGSIDGAVTLFQKAPKQSAALCTAMIAAYARHGHDENALTLFGKMQRIGIQPNQFTFASALPACANLAALECGRSIHEDIIRNGFQSHNFVENALIDMYAKCGSVDNARRVFEKMSERDTVSWNSLIVGYAVNGHGNEARELFVQMQHSGLKPNHVTFIGVLSACCHSGLVDDGWQYFDQMVRVYHITPAAEHYCCMVDLLGRAGYLDEAYDFINKTPIEADAAVWGSLLGACRLHNNVELGECVAQHLFELDPKKSGHYVLLSNIYAEAGRWDCVEKVRKMMKNRKVKKNPGCSWIEVNNKVHDFFIGERSQPEMHQVC